MNKRGRTKWVTLFAAWIWIVALIFTDSDSFRQTAAIVVAVLIGCSLICHEISLIPGSTGDREKGSG